jgi:hypothetical protein
MRQPHGTSNLRDRTLEDNFYTYTRAGLGRTTSMRARPRWAILPVRLLRRMLAGRPSVQLGGANRVSDDERTLAWQAEADVTRGTAKPRPLTSEYRRVLSDSAACGLICCRELLPNGALPVRGRSV